MELLQLREREIFDVLKKISRFDFVVIGGYAVNTYALPRFSVDCDIVVLDNDEAKKICKELERNGYVQESGPEHSSYAGEFLRCVKTIEHGFKVSIDILAKEVFDGQTSSTFGANWVFKNSFNGLLKGKTITEEVKLRISKVDALLVMKMISCRNSDVRDVFMMITKAEDPGWIKEEIEKRYSFKDRIDKIIEKISSKQFKDNLQGIYGYVDERLFEKHKQELIRMMK